MLPSETTLKISNPDVPTFESSRDMLFSTWRYKEGSKESAWDVFNIKFPAQHKDIESLLKVETSRQAWNARFSRFWNKNRWKLPKSVDSGKKKNFRENKNN